MAQAHFLCACYTHVAWGISKSTDTADSARIHTNWERIPVRGKICCIDPCHVLCITCLSTNLVFLQIDL